MKEYELHISVEYKTSGGSTEYDYYMEYIAAKNAREATRIVRNNLRAEGYRVLSIDAVEA